MLALSWERNLPGLKFTGQYPNAKSAGSCNRCCFCRSCLNNVKRSGARHLPLGLYHTFDPRQVCWRTVRWHNGQFRRSGNLWSKRSTKTGYLDRNSAQRVSSSPGERSSPTKVDYICADHLAQLNFRLQKSGGHTFAPACTQEFTYRHNRCQRKSRPRRSKGPSSKSRNLRKRKGPKLNHFSNLAFCQRNRTPTGYCGGNPPAAATESSLRRPGS